MLSHHALLFITLHLQNPVLNPVSSFSPKFVMLLSNDLFKLKSQLILPTSFATQTETIDSCYPSMPYYITLQLKAPGLNPVYSSLCSFHIICSSSNPKPHSPQILQAYLLPKQVMPYLLSILHTLLSLQVCYPLFTCELFKLESQTPLVKNPPTSLLPRN